MANEVGDVEGEEVAGGKEAGDGLQVDVVGVEEVGLGPAEFFDSGISGFAGLGGIGSR